MRGLRRSPGHLRKQLGAPPRIHVWNPMEGGRFPDELDERRNRLLSFAEVILETAARHGLSTVEVASARRLKVTFVDAKEARVGLDDMMRYQDGSTLWQLGEIAWSDPGRSNVLVHYGDPDGYGPLISAWGPKAETILDDIDAGWSRLS